MGTGEGVGYDGGTMGVRGGYEGGTMGVRWGGVPLVGIFDLLYPGIYSYVVEAAEVVSTSTATGTPEFDFKYRIETTECSAVVSVSSGSAPVHTEPTYFK